jgi:hypothetical protein
LLAGVGLEPTSAGHEPAMLTITPSPQHAFFYNETRFLDLLYFNKLIYILAFTTTNDFAKAKAYNEKTNKIKNQTKLKMPSLIQTRQ